MLQGSGVESCFFQVAWQNPPGDQRFAVKQNNASVTTLDNQSIDLFKRNQRFAVKQKEVRVALAIGEKYRFSLLYWNICLALFPKP